MTSQHTYPINIIFCIKSNGWLDSSWLHSSFLSILQKFLSYLKTTIDKCTYTIIWQPYHRKEDAYGLVFCNLSSFHRVMLAGIWSAFTVRNQIPSY